MPARDINQVVQDTLGAQTLAICRLQAELEAAQQQIADLTAENAQLRAKLSPSPEGV